MDVGLAGEYPGDRKPKPVAFPDPAEAAVRGRRIALLPLDKLIELKLASGMSAPHRLKDLADVLELIRVLSLPRERALSLDASVRAKYDELWQAAPGRRSGVGSTAGSTPQPFASGSVLQRKSVLDSLEGQLAFQPTVETRNRKRLRPNPVAPRELRLGHPRVYFDVRRGRSAW